MSSKLVRYRRYRMVRREWPHPLARGHFILELQDVALSYSSNKSMKSAASNLITTNTALTCLSLPVLPSLDENLTC